MKKHSFAQAKSLPQNACIIEYNLIYYLEGFVFDLRVVVRGVRFGVFSLTVVFWGTFMSSTYLRPRMRASLGMPFSPKDRKLNFNREDILCE